MSFLTSAFLVRSQSLQLVQLSDSLPIANGYTFNIAANDPQVVFEVIVKNVSANSLSTKVRRTILSATAGQDMYFCFGSTCYTPSTAVSNNAVTIAGGQQLPNGVGTYGIRTEFDNNGVVGSSTVKYTAFDVANTSDTAVLYITYNVTAVGVETFNSSASVSNAFPNPATEQIKISHNISGSFTNSAIKIYNALGTIVKTVPVTSARSTSQIDVSDLQEGFYFYTLVSNGKNSATKKFVVSR